MAELLTLTTPIANAATTDYAVRYLELNMDQPSVVVAVRDNRGVYVRHAYTSTTAMALMSFMNTKDFRSTSIQKEVIKRLQNDGVIGAGTVSGTPD